MGPDDTDVDVIEPEKVKVLAHMVGRDGGI